eukprot:TRINITY_DN63874_c0_g1_i1.p1 TRINITY_DN63874_c0_g1~~TRINITY_DN63874_c0_g1_i1.p1  ORF type:complete len:137 (-),score=13.05 TRINITY_DN63874_c0_g1_i1:114-524(-)
MVNACAFQIGLGMRAFVILSSVRLLDGAAVTEQCQGPEGVCPGKSRRGMAMLQRGPSQTKTVVSLRGDTATTVEHGESTEQSTLETSPQENKQAMAISTNSRADSKGSPTVHEPTVKSNSDSTSVSSNLSAAPSEP